MILLINPKTTKSSEVHSKYFREPNLGLLYLAAILDVYNLQVEILDLEQYANLEKFDFQKIIESNFPGFDIFGFTSLTNNFALTLKLIKVIKSIKPNSQIILGGPHASFLYKSILKDFSVIDYICVGEAEESFPSLINLLIKFTKTSKNPQFFSQLRKIKGVAYTSDDKIHFNGHPNPTNIEKIPLPARYKLNQENYYYRVASVIINRGCPNQCSFCSRQNLFRKPRIRSIESILLEIEDIISLQNYQYINFYDNININSQFFKDFCKMFILNNIKIPWGCELRVDSLTEEEVKLLKKAGCKLVATGIESANEEILTENFKYQDPERVLEGISLLKKENIPVQAYFVLGLPGETKKSVKQTIEYIRTLPLGPDDQINYFAATPYPGSRLWEERDKFRIKIEERDYSKYDCEHIIFSTQELSIENLRHLFKLVKAIETEINNS